MIPTYFLSLKLQIAMAPFAQNMREVRLVEQGKRETTNVDSQSLEAQFEARIDGEWAVLVVPNGGYLLGLLIQASTMFQEGSPLSEPLYLSAQFLGSTSVGPCTIVVNKIKSGKSYVNLTAKLVQKVRSPLHFSFSEHPLGSNKYPLSTHLRQAFGSSTSLWRIPSHPKSTHARPSLWIESTLSAFCPPIQVQYHSLWATLSIRKAFSSSYRPVLYRQDGTHCSTPICQRFGWW